MSRRPIAIRPPSMELADVDLGDKRLNRRLCLVADALASQPGVSLPHACRTTAAREGAYLLLSNKRVVPAAILEPHFDQTRERAQGDTDLLAIHDSTEFAFGGEARSSLGRTNNNKPGFFAHVSLGIRAVNREQLGVLACRACGIDDSRRRSRGDQYRLLAAVIERGSRCVVRSHRDRSQIDGTNTAWERVADAKVVIEREVQLARRVPKHEHAKQGPRDARTARLGIAGASIEVKRAWGPHNRAVLPAFS